MLRHGAWLHEKRGILPTPALTWGSSAVWLYYRLCASRCTNRCTSAQKSRLSAALCGVRTHFDSIGTAGFEPTASRPPGARSTRLSYVPRSRSYLSARASAASRSNAARSRHAFAIGRIRQFWRAAIKHTPASTRSRSMRLTAPPQGPRRSRQRPACRPSPRSPHARRRSGRSPGSSVASGSRRDLYRRR